MTQHGWMSWILLAVLILLGIFPGYLMQNGKKKYQKDKIRDCFYKNEGTPKKALVVADNFYGIIKAKNHNISTEENDCIIFVKKSGSDFQGQKWWPQLVETNGSYLLYISDGHLKQNSLVVLYGKYNATRNLSKECYVRTSDATCTSCSHNVSTYVQCVDLDNKCKMATYDKKDCKGLIENTENLKNRYIFNMSKLDPNCTNCEKPVQEPDEKVQLPVDLQITPEGEINAGQAAKIVNLIGDFVSSLNGSSAELSVGEGVSGILVKQTHVEDAEEVSFGYANPNQSINIIQDREFLTGFSRSVTVSKEAFQQAFNSSNSTFAAVFRFINMAEDEKNSTVLGDEVLAIEMGTKIANLTDKININFKNMKYKGIPACHSWDGKGAKPNWTEDGCVTNITGRNITCQCTHLTFFAILLTPLNETISSTDLKNLNIITQVGCGLSMFFLGIVLFMHFLTRRKKASKSTRILVHLVSAMFFLDFAFLINNYVARLNNTWACKIMAAVMHYFLLATFTWFAVQAFHLCLQLYMAGKIVIHRYILKVSVTSWIIPSLIVVVLLIVGKYGQQIVQADNAENAESLCWITDTDIHYIVNIGYYVVVFLFTFTTFIIVVSWLFCLKNPKLSGQVSQNGKSILTIMGLCCILGITWGFAFLAYGVLRIPSYYIFTILNSFQGFFLFIYYYNTSHTGEANAGAGEQSNLSSTSSISSSTLNTSLETTVNPYHNIRRNLSFLK